LGKPHYSLKTETSPLLSQTLRKSARENSNERANHKLEFSAAVIWCCSAAVVQCCGWG